MVWRPLAPGGKRVHDDFDRSCCSRRLVTKTSNDFDDEAFVSEYQRSLVGNEVESFEPAHDVLLSALPSPPSSPELEGLVLEGDQIDPSGAAENRQGDRADEAFVSISTIPTSINPIRSASLHEGLPERSALMIPTEPDTPQAGNSRRESGKSIPGQGDIDEMTLDALLSIEDASTTDEQKLFYIKTPKKWADSDVLRGKGSAPSTLASRVFSDRCKEKYPIHRSLSRDDRDKLYKTTLREIKTECPGFRMWKRVQCPIDKKKVLDLWYEMLTEEEQLKEVKESMRHKKNFEKRRRVDV